MKDKTNLKLVITALVSIIVSSSITAFAAIRFQANEVGYNTTTVADALDSLYQTQFSDNISTTERVIGKWLDGRPLYQKTVIVNYTTADIQNYAHDIADVDMIYLDAGNTFFTGSSYDTGAYFSVGMSGGTVAAGYSKIIQSVNRTTITIRGCANAGSGTAYITLKYTKTTDQVPNN